MDVELILGLERDDGTWDEGSALIRVAEYYPINEIEL